MIEIHFLGGCEEVGRSALIVDNGVEKFLLDYGIDVQNFQGPIKPDLNMDAVFLTHSHLDHCGMLPSLYKRGYTESVFATPPTLSLSSLLLRDSIKVQEKRDLMPYYLSHDIWKMEDAARFLEFRKKLILGNSIIEFYSSGHIPGSSSILLETQNKRILYTGDIKFIDTKLMKGADTSYKDIDCVICESTYSYKNHPKRENLEKKLKEIVKETINNDGIALLPCFAVGRTQELLLILSELKIPIYLDGMGIEATRITLNYPSYIKNAKKLKTNFKNAKKVKRPTQRAKIIQEPCIILTTAGMLNGGPVTYYIKKLYKKENCSLILTGYQVEGTAGRVLLDTGRYVNEGLDLKVKMRIEFLDFSAHTDHDHIVSFLEKVNPKKILLVHGPQTQKFAEELKNKGFNAYSPKNGEKIKI